MKTFSLLLALLVCAGAATADSETGAPKTHAVVVGPEGTIELKHALFEGEDGSHLLMFSNVEGPNWKKIQPGETRLVLMVHGKVEAGHFTTTGSGEVLQGLFEHKELEAMQAFSAILYTNTSKSEVVTLKQVFGQAVGGKHLLTCGALTVKGTPAFKASLSADFALVFDGVSVAGRVSEGAE